MFFRTNSLRKAFKSATIGRLAVGGLLLALASGLAAERVEAQQTPTLSSDQLQQLQGLQGGVGRSTNPTQPETPREIILQPMGPTNQQLPTSRLEQILSGRAGVKLTQFGYDQLGVGRAVTLSQQGAVQDYYILGPGDEIVVTLRGQENSEYRSSVDRNGMITLPRLSPISASGRTLGDVRRDIINAIHRAYVSTEGYVSIGRLRQISVLVSGEVRSPGVRTLTGLSTAVDAILISGGVKKTGSLRNVHILRGGGEITVDLYSVMTGQARSSRVALADGDRLVVPPLGPTAAVVGWVRRPGIYEIAEGRSSIGVRDLLSLAGGLEVRGKYRLSVLRMTSDGRNQMISLGGQSGTIGDSEILFAQPSANQTTSMATLSGGTALAGQYSIKNTKLSELLKSPGALGDNPYTLFGIISRRDPVTLLRTLVAFTPVAVLKGAEDMNIQSDDIVRSLSTKEARVLFSTVQEFGKQRQSSEEALYNPQSAGVETNKLGGTESGAAAAAEAAALQAPGSVQASREALAAASNTAAIRSAALDNNNQATNQDGTQPASQPDQTRPDQMQPDQMQQGQMQQGAQSPSQPLAPNLQEGMALPGQVPTNREIQRLSQLASQLSVDSLVLVSFLNDHSVNIDGAVRGPGLYLVGPDSELQSVLMAAGGVSRWADRSSVEVLSTSVDSNTGTARTERKIVSLADAAGAGYIVSPRDEVRVNAVFTDVGIGSISVQGQVRHGGTYQIVRGEHLSDILMRAGGLTDNAYPYGTVFLRRSVADREQDAFRREAKEIEDQLLLAISRRDPNSKLSPDAFGALQGYVNQLKNQKALGRVSVMADPAVLAANPASDPLLEPGDVVYIPQRPYSIAVLGEVLQPGSVPFRQDMAASDYVARAGGYGQFADKSETILVLPDGSARRVETSWLDFGSDSIPPGSTIYVTRDISGIDLHQIIVDTTAIFSQLATSAAALAVLSKQ